MARADPNTGTDQESPWYRSLGPSGAMLKQASSGDTDVAMLVEELFKRSPQAMLAKTVANQPFVRNFAKSASAGLTEPVAAGLSALVEKPLQWAGRLPERSVGEAYRDFRGRGREDLERMKEESGGQVMLGDLAGVVAPGGAFGRVYSVTNKATAPLAKFGEKLMTKGTAGKIGGWLTKYAVRPALRGGTAQVGYEAINAPESRVLRDAEHLRNAFLLGAAGDAGGEIGMQGLKAGWAGLKGIGRGLVKGAKSTPFLGGFIEGMEEAGKKKAAEAFQEGAEGLGKKVGAESPMAAGEGFREGVDDLYQNMFAKYKKVRDPVMKKFAGERAAATKLREQIAGALDEAGVLDAKGNINFDSPVFHGPDAADYRLLAKYSESLRGNPTMTELDNLIKGFGNRANFGARDRTPMQRIYAHLYSGGRDDLLDSAEALVTAAHKSGPQYRGAEKALDKAMDLSADYSAQLKEPLTGERLKAVLQEGKEGASQKVFEAQEKLTGMGQAAEDTGELTAELIRQARKEFATTKGVLDEMRNISRKTPEAIVAGASSKTKTGLPGSTILSAVESVPELRGPIAKAVMGNILAKGKDPKSLTRAIDAFGDRQALEALFGPEVMGVLGALEKSGQKNFGAKASQLYDRAHQWAVRNPQAARPGLFVPREMLNQAQPVENDEGEPE